MKLIVDLNWICSLFEMGTNGETERRASVEMSESTFSPARCLEGECACHGRPVALHALPASC